MILMEEVSGDGRKRRCCATCYNAKKQKCICICGGKNHGVGLNRAIDNCNVVAQKILFDPVQELWK